MSEPPDIEEIETTGVDMSNPPDIEEEESTGVDMSEPPDVEEDIWSVYWEMEFTDIEYIISSNWSSRSECWYHSPSNHGVEYLSLLNVSAPNCS